MKKNGVKLFAAIHLGSEVVSIKIVEYRSLNSIKVLTYAERKVIIGEETFKTGKISTSMVREICEILKKYKRMMKEFGVVDHVVIGTTAMREAKNHIFMIDQIYMLTGFKVNVIDMPLEIYLKYLYISRTLKDDSNFDTKEATLFADISSGGLGITVVENGSIMYQQNMHIGVIRAIERFDKNQRASSGFNNALTEYINSIVAPVHHRLKSFSIKKIVLSGSNTSLILGMLNINKQEEVISVDTEKFSALYNNVIDLKLAKIMKDFDLSENIAQLVLSTIIFYQELIALTSITKIIFTPNTFIDAIILSYIAKNKKHHWIKDTNKELIDFIYNIANKYNYDALHSKQVVKFSEIIFDRMKNIHGLEERARLLLTAASILHDIGKYINLRKHYLYSCHLILSTDIFGLSDNEKRLVALVVYHHAVDTFEKIPESIVRVNTNEIPLVAKLASILRLADALDRGYRQKIKNLKISFKDDEVYFLVDAKEDISLEKWTFEDKVQMFIEVFGLKPILIEQNK